MSPVPSTHQRLTSRHIARSLENIYISPLESCNLNCKYCYTTKTKQVLSNTQILKFVSKYRQHLQQMSSLSSRGGLRRGLNLKSILFCGGEVFTLGDFPKLVNQLLANHIFITIITNGTIDRLSEISDPANCQLIVSFDGPKDTHDANRGNGNFDKSVKFVRHALDLGFPVGIFYLVTKDSYQHIDKFNLFNLKITYLVDRLNSLSADQTLNLLRHYPTYPSKNFGCFQLALQSDGYIYGCCESSVPLASISDPVDKIIKNFTNSLSSCQKCRFGEASQIFRAQSSEWCSYEGVSTAKFVCEHKRTCHGCCQPDFLCGCIKQLNVSSCQSVINLL